MDAANTPIIPEPSPLSCRSVIECLSAASIISFLETSFLLTFNAIWRSSSGGGDLKLKATPALLFEAANLSTILTVFSKILFDSSLLSIDMVRGFRTVSTFSLYDVFRFN